MFRCKFSLLLCALALLWPLRPQATSGHFHSPARPEAPSRNESQGSQGSSGYEEVDFEETPELNESLDAEWKISVRNGNLVLRHERTREESLESDEIYYTQELESPKDSALFSNATQELLLGNLSFASVPEVLLVLDAGPPCKNTGDKGVPCDHLRGRKRPFHRFYPFLKECRNRRRPRRCRRLRRRRRRTTPRPTALLANFTFINQVNNQGYLTMSNVSNLNSSSRE